MADLGKGHDTDELIKAYEKTMEMQEKNLEEKTHLIKTMGFVIAVLVAVFIGIVIFNLANGSIGWARYSEPLSGTAQITLGALTEFFGP